MIVSEVKAEFKITPLMKKMIEAVDETLNWKSTKILNSICKNDECVTISPKNKYVQTNKRAHQKIDEWRFYFRTGRLYGVHDKEIEEMFICDDEFCVRSQKNYFYAIKKQKEQDSFQVNFNQSWFRVGQDWFEIDIKPSNQIDKKTEKLIQKFKQKFFDNKM